MDLVGFHNPRVRARLRAFPVKRISLTSMRVIENELVILDDLLAAPPNLTLSPSQQAAADELLRALPAATVLLLKADVGMGKTSILR
jgi:superfamily II DNA or RNA helicase